MLSLDPRMKLRPEEDGDGFLTDTQTATILVLNPVAMSVMSLLQQKPSEVDDVVEHVCSRFTHDDRAKVCDEIAAFISKAVEVGLVVKTDPQPAGG